VDHEFGRLLDKLAERGLAGNTVVVYTSDHGDHFGSHAAPTRKSTPEDVSVRVPLLIRGPGVPRGAVSELLLGLLDLPPTLLGLMGFAVPEHWDGQDLSAAVRELDDEAVQSQPLFFFDPAWRGVYTRRYTFAVENIERHPQRYRDTANTLRRRHLRSYNVLYDRQVDPYQLHNRFNDNACLDVAAELGELTESWLQRFADPFPSFQQLNAENPEPQR